MEKYDASKYPPFAVTVDLVVLAIIDESLHVLTVKRGVAPYKGRLALPGGFVRERETLDEAAVRELREETGLAIQARHSEQLGAYGHPKRDSRMRVVSVAYLLFAPDPGLPKGSSDADTAQWTPVAELMDVERSLAFDHNQILADGVERARWKLEFTNLAATFCGGVFTISELHNVYRAIWGEPKIFNFHRKVVRDHRKVGKDGGFIERTSEFRRQDRGRPAELYKACEDEEVFLSRPVFREVRRPKQLKDPTMASVGRSSRQRPPTE